MAKAVSLLALLILTACSATAKPLPTPTGWNSRNYCYHLCAGPNGELKT